jgi:hypothetical protein
MKGCGHCGYRGLLEEKERVKVDSRTDYIDAVGEFGVDTFWILHRCPDCGDPTLEQYFWIEPFTDPEDEGIRLYPLLPDLSLIPDTIQAAYDLALKGKRVDPAFYAVGVRRTLEAVCNHENVPDGRLHQRLEQLAQSGRLPPDLKTLTLSLKEIGNLGAHESGIEITQGDVPAVADLLEALLEYLYRAPARLEAVRARFSERGVSI